jgi:hypothetical protein
VAHLSETRFAVSKLALSCPAHTRHAAKADKTLGQILGTGAGPLEASQGLGKYLAFLAHSGDGTNLYADTISGLSFDFVGSLAGAALALAAAPGERRATRRDWIA